MPSPSAFPRRLRRDSTDAETLLWRSLRDREIFGRKFRRQHPVGPWILDFFCRSARLAIELDGGGHAEPQRTLRDERRTKDLASRGIRVLRFWNTDVFENLEGVLEQIGAELDPPSSSPPGDGGRG